MFVDDTIRYTRLSIDGLAIITVIGFRNYMNWIYIGVIISFIIKMCDDLTFAMAFNYVFKWISCWSFQSTNFNGRLSAFLNTYCTIYIVSRTYMVRLTFHRKQSGLPTSDLSNLIFIAIFAYVLCSRYVQVGYEYMPDYCRLSELHFENIYSIRCNSFCHLVLL